MGPSQPPIVTPELIQTGHDIAATKALFLASLTFLIYDHLLTFDQEVKYFWSQTLTVPSILFFLNRYYTHISYGIIAYLFMNPAASNPKTCFPASMFLPLGGTLPISVISSLILTTRVYAIYNRNKWLLSFLLIFLCALVGTSVWLYGFAGHIPLPLPSIPLDAYRICIDATAPKIPQNTTITWILMQCSFDLTVLVLTLGRSIRMTKTQISSLFQVIRRDGVFYFLCIFSSNFAWAMMVLTASPGIKYIIAIPNLAICATAAARISINLRAAPFTSAATNCYIPPGGLVSLDASVMAFTKAQAQSLRRYPEEQHELQESPQSSAFVDEDYYSLQPRAV